jgi:antitoxin PrlF
VRKSSRVTLSSKGQVVIPAAVRDHLGLREGAQLDLVEEEEGLRLTVVRSVARVELEKLSGMIKPRPSGRKRRLMNFDAAAMTRKRAP